MEGEDLHVKERMSVEEWVVVVEELHLSGVVVVELKELLEMVLKVSWRHDLVEEVVPVVQKALRGNLGERGEMRVGAERACVVTSVLEKVVVSSESMPVNKR